MIGNDPLFGLRAHSPVDTTNPLHEPDRIPVKIIVDQASRILKVQTFREYVSRNENAGLC